MNPLTSKELETQCRSLLDPVTRYIIKTMGDEASTYTGECLLTALKSYDGSKGDIHAYARTKTRLLIIDELRRMDGRKGSPKYNALSARTSLESFDGFNECDPSKAAEHEDEFIKTLGLIGRAAKFHRILLFGRLLVGLTDAELQRLTNVSKTKIWTETLSLRELVSPR